MKYLFLLGVFFFTLNSYGITEADLENIFHPDSKTPQVAQDLIKSWYAHYCGNDLSWIVDIKEVESENYYCTEENEAIVVQTVVELSHLGSDFTFSVDLLKNEILNLYKSEKSWQICHEPGFEVETKEELCPID